MEIQFIDKSVTFDIFVNNLAAKLVTFIKEDKDDPEYISQNEAYKRYGRSNVERWVKKGRIEPCKRVRKIEYNLVRLKELARIVQDYLYQ